MQVQGETLRTMTEFRRRFFPERTERENEPDQHKDPRAAGIALAQRVLRNGRDSWCRHLWTHCPRGLLPALWFAPMADVVGQASGRRWGEDIREGR